MNKEFENRTTFRAAAFLVLEKDNRVLMHKRINTSHEEGNYGLVSGHLEGKETAHECIIREAFEEAGITIAVKDLRVVHVSHNNAGDYSYFLIFLTTDQWKGEPRNMEPERCGDLSWFSLDSLPPNTIEYIRSALKDIKQGVFYSNF